MKFLQSLLPYAESVPLPQTARQFLRLSQPMLTGSFTLEQLAIANDLYPYLSTLQVRMHGGDARPYQLTYRSHGPIDNVSDSERNSPSLEFRSAGPYSQITPLTDRDEYGRLAAKVKDIAGFWLAGHAKLHDIQEVGQDWTQIITLIESIDISELVAIVVRLPHENTDTRRLRPVYVNVPTSVYLNALERKLPLKKTDK